MTIPTTNTTDSTIRLRTGPRPLLTEEQVEELKVLRHDYHKTYEALSTIFGVSKKTIHYYLHNPNKHGRTTPRTY